VATSSTVDMRRRAERRMICSWLAEVRCHLRLARNPGAMALVHWIAIAADRNDARRLPQA
jgi:hypothetical protein